LCHKPLGFKRLKATNLCVGAFFRLCALCMSFVQRLSDLPKTLNPMVRALEGREGEKERGRNDRTRVNEWVSEWMLLHHALTSLLLHFPTAAGCRHRVGLLPHLVPAHPSSQLQVSTCLALHPHNTTSPLLFDSLLTAVPCVRIHLFISFSIWGHLATKVVKP
jgi:hypothetical protein